jgi:hypothetical protein
LPDLEICIFVVDFCALILEGFKKLPVRLGD